MWEKIWAWPDKCQGGAWTRVDMSHDGSCWMRLGSSLYWILIQEGWTKIGQEAIRCEQISSTSTKKDIRYKILHWTKGSSSGFQFWVCLGFNFINRWILIKTIMWPLPSQFLLKKKNGVSRPRFSISDVIVGWSFNALNRLVRVLIDSSINLKLLVALCSSSTMEINGV